MYIRCTSNPSATPASVGATTAGEKTKEATVLCKQLYQDRRLDPLRSVIALGEPPTLQMQSDRRYVTDEQRAALDVFKSLNEQCRNNIAAANPRLWQIVVQIQPSPYEHLRQLYDRKITIGEYNSYRQEMMEKLNNALAGPPK